MANALSMQHDGQSSAAHSSPSMNDASTQGDSRNKNGSINHSMVVHKNCVEVDADHMIERHDSLVKNLLYYSTSRPTSKQIW